MTPQRLVGLPVLMFVAACATTTRTVVPRAELVPQGGPKARITASYTGGITNRRVSASFRVDRSAFVMVGHLAGDGRIRVLFPETPDESSRVQGKKTYAVQSTAAQYDAVPQLYSFASRAYRSTGARTDSYDGRGNGYIFLIASAYPLDLDALTIDGEWDEFEVEDYNRTADPRISINEFAKQLAGGARFTLDYADSFSTNAFTSYATSMYDCTVLSSILSGFMTSSAGLWGYNGFFMSPMRGMSFASFGGLPTNHWYFYRPAMYYTHASSGWSGSSPYGYDGCGPSYASVRTAYYPEYPTWTYRPARIPLDTTGAPLTPRTHGGVPGTTFGSERSAALALTRTRPGGTTSGSAGASTSRNSANRAWSADRPGHRSDPGFHSGDPGFASRPSSQEAPARRAEPTYTERPREAPINSAPRMTSPPPAPAAQPAAPPPRVSEVKPKDP